MDGKMLDLLIEHAVPLFVLIISLGFFRDCSHCEMAFGIPRNS